MRRNGNISNADEMTEFVPLRELATVIMVAKVGGVTKAAEALGYAQPTVTLHIRTMERYLGATLFERAGRKLVITPAGRAVVDRGGPLLRNASSFRSSLLEARREVRGVVRLAGMEPSASLRLPPIVAKLAKSHPHIDVEIRVAGSPAAAELVRSHEVDFAICSPPRDKKLRFRPLFDEQLSLLVPRRHRLAHAKSVSVSELVSEKILVSDESCVYRTLVQWALDAGHVDVALEANFGTISTLPYGVAAGLGVAIIPNAVVSRLLPGTSLIPLRKPELALTVGTLLSADHPLSDAAQVVLRTVEQVLLARKGAR